MTADDGAAARISVQAETGAHVNALGHIFVRDHATFVFAADDAGPLAAALKHQATAPSARAWVDPADRCELPPALDGIDPGELTHAVSQMHAQRVLVVECVDGTIQWAAASAVIARLPVRPPALRGSLSDNLPDSDRPADDAAAASGERARWNEATILHPELGGGPCVLLLEVEGGAGQSLVDRAFHSQGHFESVRDRLADLGRYLVLLPRGRVAGSLLRDHARRGFTVRTLRIPFLTPWLRREFPADAARHAEVIAAVTRAGWTEREDALYELLCRQLGAAQPVLAQLLAIDRQEPAALTVTREALACTDGTCEPLLAAIFVATYLPGLGELDFARIVEILLAGRTRRVVTAGAPATTASLLEDWRHDTRHIVGRAMLIVHQRPGEIHPVGFGEADAADRIRAHLDAQPLLVKGLLERLRDAGLLFDPSRQVSRAMIELLVTSVRADPFHFDAAWLFRAMRQIRPDLDNLPLNEETVELHQRDLSTRHLGGAHALLRRLVDVRAEADGRTDGAGLREATIVSGLLERVLQLNTPAAAQLVLELAHRLRDAPGFKAWYWIRQVYDRGGALARALADRIVDRIADGDDVDARGAFDAVLGWLPEAGKPGGAAARAAIRWVARWVVASIEDASGLVSAVGPTGLIQRVVARDGAAAIGRLVAALHHPAVIEDLIEQSETLGAMIIGLLLPVDGDEVTESALSGVGAVFDAWNAAVKAQARDVDAAELPRHLIPALALVSWALAFDDRDEVIHAIAVAIHGAPTRGRRTPLAGWLTVLIAAMGAAQNYIADAALDDRRVRARWWRTAQTRRAALIRLRTLAQGGLAT